MIVQPGEDETGVRNGLAAHIGAVKFGEGGEGKGESGGKKEREGEKGQGQGDK